MVDEYGVVMPESYVRKDRVEAAYRADSAAWEFFLASPENYRRIKADRIQHYHHTDREEYAQRLLAKFIHDCHAGKLQSGWSDFGRLEE